MTKSSQKEVTKLLLNSSGTFTLELEGQNARILSLNAFALIIKVHLVSAG